MEQFKSLKDHVYDYIAEGILKGTIAPNEKISENIICDELNISRTPVREALIQLTGEGVLKNLPRKGFVVTSLTHEDLQKLYIVLGQLDGLAAKYACPNLTPQDLKDLRFYIDSMDLAINSGNFEIYLQHQKAFHKIYMQKCGNAILTDVLDKLSRRLLRKSYQDDEKGETKKVLLRTNNEHRELVRLFEQGLSDEAEKFLSKTHWSPDNAHYDVFAK